MSIRYFACLLVIVLLAGMPIAVAPTAVALGSVYYVATTGVDTIPGGTSAQPWRTIQFAVDHVVAGDTIRVRSGTYVGCRIENSGTATDWITLQADAGAHVVINASGPNNKHQSNVELENWDGTVAYWVIEGLEVTGAPSWGIDVRGSESDFAHHITVRGCTVHHNGVSTGRTGIFLAFVNYPLIEYNESYSNGEHGIYDSNSGDYPVIRGNRLHHNRNCGLHMNGDASMGGDGVISHGLVEDNVVYENGTGGGSGINMDGVTDTVIRNNLLYNNHASGISAYQIDGGSGSQNNRLLNNTIVMPADGRWAINIPDTNDTGNQVFNNILFTYHASRGSILIAQPGLTGFASDYNVVVSRFSTDGGDTTINLTNWRALGYDTHSLIATPDQLFVNAAAGDYHLKAGSPAMDAGTALPDVTDDLEGNPRPAGPAFDIGAYEYQGYGFTLTASPAGRAILPGGVASYTIGIQSSEGFTASVSLVSASPSPSLTVRLVPAVGVPPVSATLTITDSHAGPLLPGLWYTVPVTATGSGVTRATSVRLLVGGARLYLPLALKNSDSRQK